MKNDKTIYELTSPIVVMHWSCTGEVMAAVKRVAVVLTKVITWLQKVTGPSGGI